ncbi:MAG: squalene cyclase [Bradyrhizobium sp.]
MASRKAVVKWLLDSDPSIRWQVMRDLTDEPDAAVAAERSRVASEGWGARLLGLQAASGQWGAEDDDGWMTTVYALALLRDLGADPADESVRRAIGLVRERITWWQLDGRPFFDGETEACINGRILAAGAYFGADGDRLVDRLLEEQLADGGWNCEAPPSKRSSFHSTICVLEGLLEYEKARGTAAAMTQARARAHDYLLERRMLRSLRSGEVIDRRWARFSFPTSWHYDLLRGLDYLRSAGVGPDERVAEAVELVKERRHQNGRWPLNSLHADHVDRFPFDMEAGVGKASRWNTLRALRVLDWYGN